MTDKPILSRETLLNGELERLVQTGRVGQRVMSEQERSDLVQSTLEYLGKDAELWFFGYGSLIWNPALEYVEQRCCSIENCQKKFCFWTTLSRGSEQQPGLMMGLVEGGGCNGVAYRIEPAKAAIELDILFRREMSSYVYKPTWVEARCTKTNTLFKALTFVVDPSSDRFVDHLLEADIVRIIAKAQGPLGRNCDYLFQLFDSLCELGFDEPELNLLVERVKTCQRGDAE